MIYEVKLPILGFEGISRVELTKVDDLLTKMKDVDSELTFTLINPYILRDYNFKLPISVSTLLDVEDNSKLNVFNFLMVYSNVSDSKINFLAPLIFNEDTQTMAQAKLESNQYPAFNVATDIKEFVA